MKKKNKFLPIANPDVGINEAKAAYEVIKKGWISMGKKVSEFEEKVKKLIKVKHAIYVNNGTSALHCALLALGIKQGDEVIVPTLSYISSANAVLYCGAKPIFCEVDPKTFNVNYDYINSKITKKTKAIISVDLKGQPVDYNSIRKLEKKYKIPIISDSAESFGAIYRNKYVGSQMLIHTFSFFANKNITTGEGGLITTENDNLAKKLRIIRNQGQDKRYNHIELGNNFRPTDYSAAIGIEQLKKINKVISEKGKIAKIYSRSFNENENIITPHLPEYVTRPSWYMYCLTFKTKKIKKKVKQALEQNNIDTRLSFPPIHNQPYYKSKFKKNIGKYKQSEDIFQKFLDIPIWMGMGEKNIRRVISIIKKAAN
jgi:perosamine synthetase